MDKILETMLLFYLFCIVGWIWECFYMSIRNKKLTNRGFLTGPYIPIYGLGGIAVYLVFQKYSGNLFSINTLYIYLLGLIFATTLEYLTSILMEIIFKARWWDYSNEFLNLNGRICLISSLFWGLLSVIFIQIVNPLLLKHIININHDLKLIIVTALTTTMLIDIAITIIAIINLQEKISNILSFEKNALNTLKGKIENIQELSYKQILSDYKARLYNISNPFTKRLISAFPKLNFKSKERQNIFIKLKEIKENIKNKR